MSSTLRLGLLLVSGVVLGCVALPVTTRADESSQPFQVGIDSGRTRLSQLDPEGRPRHKLPAEGLVARLQVRGYEVREILHPVLNMFAPGPGRNPSSSGVRQPLRGTDAGVNLKTNDLIIVLDGNGPFSHNEVLKYKSFVEEGGSLLLMTNLSTEEYLRTELYRKAPEVQPLSTAPSK
jgi:hypothetical protein